MIWAINFHNFQKVFSLPKYKVDQTLIPYGTSPTGTFKNTTFQNRHFSFLNNLEDKLFPGNMHQLVTLWLGSR